MLPWYEIEMVWEYYLKIEDTFPGFDTRDYINLEKLKQYIQLIEHGQSFYLCLEQKFLQLMDLKGSIKS